MKCKEYLVKDLNITKLNLVVRSPWTTAYCYCPLYTAHCLLSIVHCPLFTANCPLFTDRTRYVAGLIPAVKPRYCTKKLEKCSLEQKKTKKKKTVYWPLPTVYWPNPLCCGFDSRCQTQILYKEIRKMLFRAKKTKKKKTVYWPLPTVTSHCLQGGAVNRGLFFADPPPSPLGAVSRKISEIR